MVPLYTSLDPFYHLAPYEHVGWPLGLLAALLGFDCEHPATSPPTVSSTAALYAAPQLASLKPLASTKSPRSESKPT